MPNPAAAPRKATSRKEHHEQRVRLAARKVRRVARGSKRALRRKAAITAAMQFGVPRNRFADFWRLGATADAAQKVRA